MSDTSLDRKTDDDTRPLEADKSLMRRSLVSFLSTVVSGKTELAKSFVGLLTSTTQALSAPLQGQCGSDPFADKMKNQIDELFVLLQILNLDDFRPGYLSDEIGELLSEIQRALDETGGNIATYFQMLDQKKLGGAA